MSETIQFDTYGWEIVSCRNYGASHLPKGAKPAFGTNLETHRHWVSIHQNLTTKQSATVDFDEKLGTCEVFFTVTGKKRGERLSNVPVEKAIEFLTEKGMKISKEALCEWR